MPPSTLQVVANSCLLLVALFLTTPEYIVAQLETILPLIFGQSTTTSTSTTTTTTRGRGLLL